MRSRSDSLVPPRLGRADAHEPDPPRTDRSLTEPAVAVEPASEPLAAAVVRGGGHLVPATEADAVVWTDPTGAATLARLLEVSPARWIQLPFAGIEDFAHLLDGRRTWTCAKGIYGPAAAELAVGLILTAARRLHRHARSREWAGGDRLGEHRRIEGSTALLVGTGGIGRAVAALLRPMGARIFAVNRSGKPMPGAERTEPVASLAGMVGEADWIVLSASLTEQTRGLFDEATIALMRPDAWLVNVGRGGLVVTEALVDALRRNAIGGAALDVTDPEPLEASHPLWDMENALVTSHTANTWRMAVPLLAGMVERNVRAFASGGPLEGLVDVAAGY